MLNGMDKEGTRPPASSPGRGQPLRVFISYSHKDDTLRGELETHLRLLHRQGVISVWTDHMIRPGEEWKDKIDKNLDSADIILLLISADFIDSDYCYGIELKRALQRHEAGTAQVIPIILRATDWESALFGKLQALPAGARPITLWDDRDSAWVDVEKGIRKMAEDFRSRRP